LRDFFADDENIFVARQFFSECVIQGFALGDLWHNE